MSLAFTGCGGSNSHTASVEPADPAVVSVNSLDTRAVATDGQWLSWRARDLGGVMFDDGTELINLTAGMPSSAMPRSSQLDDQYVIFIANTRELFFVDTASDDLTPQLLSEHVYNTEYIQISDGIAIWFEDIDGRPELFYCDLNQGTLLPVQITDDQMYKIQCLIDNGIIVWSGTISTDHKEIFYYDLNAATPEVTQISITGEYDEWLPALDDGLIAWQGPGGGNDVEILYYDLNASSPHVVKLTNNLSDDRGVSVSNRVITWQRYENGGNEIYYIDLAATSPAVTRLTNNSTDDQSPQVTDGVISWMGYDSEDYEIYYYDLNAAAPEVVRVTDNSVNDLYMQVEGNKLFWKQSSSDTGEHILTYDIGTGLTTRLDELDNQQIDSGVQLSAGRATWVSSGDNYRIFVKKFGSDADPVAVTPAEYDAKSFDLDNGVLVWNGPGVGSLDDEIYSLDLNASSPEILQLTDNLLADTEPKIRDGVVIWRQSENSQYQIYCYDLNVVAPSVTQVSSGVNGAQSHQTDGRFITWVSGDSSDFEIFYYDLDASVPVPINLTNSTFPNLSPQIDNGIVTWYRNITDDNAEIYFADLTAETPAEVRITDNDVRDFSPQISDGLIAWVVISTTDGTASVFYYDINDPAPSVVQLFSNVPSLSTLVVSNRTISWDQMTDDDRDIFSYSIDSDSSAFQLISTTTSNDYSPYLRDGIYIWRGTNGTAVAYGQPITDGSLGGTGEDD